MKRNIYMPVSIVVRQTSGNDQHAVILARSSRPRSRCGIPAYHDDKTVPPGTRAKNGEALNVPCRWTTCGTSGWRNLPSPQPDSEFVDW